MGQNIQSGTTSVTGEVTTTITSGAVNTSVPRLPAGGTRIMGMYTGTVTTTVVNVFTPTAGKTAYITTIILGMGALVTTKIGDDIDNSFATMADAMSFNVAANTPLVLNFTPPLEIATTLDLVNSGSTSSRMTYFGWEE